MLVPEYAHLILDFITRTILGEYRSWSSSLWFFFPPPCYLVPLRPKYSPQHPILYLTINIRKYTCISKHIRVHTCIRKHSSTRYGISVNKMAYNKTCALLSLKQYGYNCLSLTGPSSGQCKTNESKKYKHAPPMFVSFTFSSLTPTWWWPCEAQTIVAIVF
jgi:hypothetical protein